MVIAFLLFWVMLFLARGELGMKGIAICAPLGLALLAGFLLFNTLWIYAVIGQVLLDIVLILIVFGGDIRIN